MTKRGRYGGLEAWLCLLMMIGGAGRAQAANASGNTALMVLYFDNNTGNKEYDHLSKGLADMMITDLSTVPTLQVLEREKLDALLKELNLQRTKYFDPHTAQRIGKVAGAAYAVSGAFLSVEPDIRLDVRVIRLDTGAIVKAATVTGKQASFFALQQKLTAQLVDGLSTVLSGAAAAQARSASNVNHVDNVGTLVDYGKGLDARDAGDLSAASQYLQKVVSSNPDFKLGKTRYMQIMKDLYSAKNTRANLLSDNERRLLDHIQAGLARGSAASSGRALGYRILNGQYHLTKVAQATKQQQPASDYRDHVRAYVDNQLRLFADTKNLAEYGNRESIDSADTQLAESLGIKQPGSSFATRTPDLVLRGLAALLMEGEFSPFAATINPTQQICYYQLDPSYPKIAFEALDQALAHIARFENAYKARETMRTLRDYAQYLAAVGRQEEAIAKLQSGLTQYPQSDEFAGTEQKLRDILAGKRSGWSCHPPR